jgi:predicted ATPase
MGAPLDSLSLHGFKSIRDLDALTLGRLNVLIGPNGAGKSNLVDFFRMLRAMAKEKLRDFVTKQGGADGFFFGGPKETKEIKAELGFGCNKYHFVLEPTAANELMVKSEKTVCTLYPGWKHHRGGGLESHLSKWKDQQSDFGEGRLSAPAYVYAAVAGWIVYHFHDTSSLAPMRREHSVHDFRSLKPDASNIAAFLYQMKNNKARAKRYERIRETIQLVAPFFDDFLLEPTQKGDEELIRLQWSQKGSSFPFQPWHLSDGTIRFVCLATALLQPDPPSTIVIDEPELGLHPFALAVLASLFRETATRTQLIVATQSAPLLNHFEPEEVIVVDRESGASIFRRLEAEPLKGWLEEYALGELWQKNVLDGVPSHE